MKRLQEIAATDPRAAQDIEMFCYQARKKIGALASALGGLDVLVFTGGIGERSAEVRRRTCPGLGFLGIELDPARNDAHASTISTPESRCIVRAILTDEDLMVARYTHSVAFAKR
jgi:acetate kinase